jgi:cytochrome c oxidase cbb3-type subunit 3
MQPFHSYKKILYTSIGALLISAAAIAQDAAAPAKVESTGYNQLEITLLVIMGLLAFVIWLLGRVLIVLGKQVIEKNAAPKILPVLLAVSLLFTAQVSSAQDTAQATSVKVVSNFGGLSASAFYFMVAVLATEVVIIFFLSFLIRRFTAELLPQKHMASVKAGKINAWWVRLNKKLTRAVPLEKEADVMLDHDYDGIRELDNPLPPWWKYGFYITIGVAVVYLLNFEVLGYGKNPTQEYNTEMAQAKAHQELYEANNKDRIDENNVPLADAAGIAKGKEIFTTVCFACHGKNGEGGVGPNLTDDYWIHKGALKDIYQSIKNGYPDKGMQAWSATYSPKEMDDLASFVKSLHGTNPPNGKAPQGELYSDSSDKTPGSPSAQSGKTDSTQAVK